MSADNPRQNVQKCAQDEASRQLALSPAAPGEGAAGGAEPNIREQRQAIEELGQMQSFDAGFYPRAGRVLEALLPNDGDKGKAQINLNLAVNPSVRISFRFVVEGEKSASGYKTRVEVAVGVTASVDLWVAEAFARAMVFGYIETQGDSGEELFRFLSYALYDRVHQVSDDAADYVWGRQFRRRTMATMDQDDYVEAGLGADFSAGVSADGGDRAVFAGVRASTGTRITAGGRTSVTMISGKLAIDHSPWSGELQVQVTGGQGNQSGVIAFSLQRMTNILPFASVLEDGSIQILMIDWVAGIVGMGQSLLLRTSGAQSQSMARRLGSIARMVRDGSLAMNIGSAAALRSAAQALRSISTVQMGQKLIIKVGVRPNEMSFESHLERLSQIEFGADDRAPVYVNLESGMRILKIGPLTVAV